MVADGAVREVEVPHGGVQEAGQLLARHAASLGSTYHLSHSALNNTSTFSRTRRSGSLRCGGRGASSELGGQPRERRRSRDRETREGSV